MKRIRNLWMVLFAVMIMITGVPGTPVICHGQEETDKSDFIAGDDERAPSVSVGEEGMVPVYADDIKDGTYDVEVESSSSMFRIVKAQLTVDKGNMTAVITLGGKGYLKLFMGTGEQAVKAEESDYADFVEDAEGAYTYTIQVEALNRELECTGFSKKKKKWYDHQILFDASTLPAEALYVQLSPAVLDKKDGDYTIELSLAGGTGKASVTSPAFVTITDKQGTAVIEWSSPDYDYMIVNGVKYLPVNTEGNSVFEIPVWALDEEIEVLADTTAMSTPHEIPYTLTFHSAALKQSENGMLTAALMLCGAAAVCIIGIGLFFRMRGKRNGICAWFILPICLMMFYGCGSLKEDAGKDENISPYLTYERSMELTYAENFAVDYYKDGYKLVTVADSSRYLVVPKNGEAPEELAEDIVILKQPLYNIYIAATAVMDMFRELDALDRIRFSGQKAEGWYIEEAVKAMEEGRILYAGKYNMPDYELILSKGCCLAVENTMISHSPEVEEKLKKFGIPVMVDYSSYEKHPLGRVEWVKLYGTLLNKEEEAREAFQAQEDILKRITEETEAEESGAGKTVAFFYIAANGAVNVRKSSDYIPKMIDLAGGSYIFHSTGEEAGSKSSINMQMEDFYKEARNADYLIYNSTVDGEIKTVEELLQKNSVLKDFKAVEEGNVYCTTSDLYQQSMSIGVFIEDIHKMLWTEKDGQVKMQYLYQLE